jgi:hypothetical protein
MQAGWPSVAALAVSILTSPLPVLGGGGPAAPASAPAAGPAPTAS